MIDPFSFSEAAKLYAGNAAIVEEMQRLCQVSIDEFLGRVLDAAKALVPPGELHQTTTAQGYQYWWLATDDLHRDQHPQIYFNSRLPAIVTPGRIELTAIAPNGSPELRQRLAGIASRPEFASYCKKGPGARWSLFTASIAYPEQNSIEHAAQPIADLLLAMRQVEVAADAS
jgi:hypothetical protein